MPQQVSRKAIDGMVYAYGEVNVGNTSGTKGLTISAYSNITYNGSNTFTVTVKGVYLIWAQQLMEANTGIYFQLNINGVTVRHGYHNGLAPYVRDVRVSDMKELNVGDTISIGQQNSTLNTWNGPHSSFRLYLIARTD